MKPGFHISSEKTLAAAQDLRNHLVNTLDARDALDRIRDDQFRDEIAQAVQEQEHRLWDNYHAALLQEYDAFEPKEG